jgi:hypothetical protein
VVPFLQSARRRKPFKRERSRTSPGWFRRQCEVYRRGTGRQGDSVEQASIPGAHSCVRPPDGAWVRRHPGSATAGSLVVVLPSIRRLLPRRLLVVLRAGRLDPRRSPAALARHPRQRGAHPGGDSGRGCPLYLLDEPPHERGGSTAALGVLCGHRRALSPPTPRRAPSPDDPAPSQGRTAEQVEGPGTRSQGPLIVDHGDHRRLPNR